MIQFRPATQSLHCLTCGRDSLEVSRASMNDPEAFLTAKEAFRAKHRACQPKPRSTAIITPIDRNREHWRRMVPALLRAASQ